ncbi:MAG: hypothetical protein H6565_00275 [Lewinellaceae bacterium]|nr:hypothetical protein [Lewinellaceae bacterium]
MKRIYPRQIQDKYYLSRLLEQYLQILAESPMHVQVKALAYDADIPEPVFHRMAALHRNPEDAPNIEANDYHILFSNILFRYPTVRIWEQNDGSVFFEL